MTFWQKVKSFFSSVFGPVVGGVATSVATAMAIKVGEISLNIMLARTGQLPVKPGYIGADGNVKLNAVREELIKFAMQKGITLTSEVLAQLVHAAQVPSI